MNESNCATQSNPTGKETLSQVISEHAKQQPRGLAFIAGEQTLTWLQYHNESNALAGLWIDHGMEVGDRIAILLPDSCETHIAFVACEKSGVVGMAIAARAGKNEIAHLINVSGATVLFSMAQHNGNPSSILFRALKKQCPQLHSHLFIQAPLDKPNAIVIDQQVVEGKITDLFLGSELLEKIQQRRVTPEDLFLLNSTSGTTGTPKCVMQNQRRWFEYAKLVQDSSAPTKDDVFLRAVPASVGFGLWSGHFAPTLLGATCVVLPSFNVNAVLDAIVAHQVSVLIAVSTQFIMLLNHVDLDQTDLGLLRVMYTGGEAVPFERAAKFEEITGAAVLQFYGSNETGALSYTTVRDSQQQRLTTAGHIIPDMQVRLWNDKEQDITASGRGQPVCNGPLTCLGYFNNDEANKKLYTSDGAMKMEDIVTISDEGYLKVIGRVGDFIIRGGKNISAAGVEEAVLACPAIHMAAAVAMPDAVFGERVCIYTVLESETTLTVAELASFLEGNGISKEYFPERIIAMDELPTVSGGKVAKKILRDDIQQRVRAETNSVA